MDCSLPHNVFWFSTPLFYEECTKKAALSNAEFKQGTTFCSCLGLACISASRCYAAATFPHRWLYSSKWWNTPSNIGVFLVFFFPSRGNRDVSIGLRQHENMVIAWLDFLRNISLRFTASVIRSWCYTPTHCRNNFS